MLGSTTAEEGLKVEIANFAGSAWEAIKRKFPSRTETSPSEETENIPSSPQAALSNIINDGLLAILNDDYKSGITGIEAIKLALDTKGKKAKFIAAVIVGGLSAYFYIPSATKAAEMICEHLGISNPDFIKFLQIMMASTGAGENAALGTYSFKEMLDKYINKKSANEAFLTGKLNLSTAEKTKNNARQIVDVVFAAANTIVNYFVGINSGGNIILTALSAGANFPVNWESVRNLKTPHEMSPDEQAQAYTADYIALQIDHFLTLPFKEQIKIMNTIKQGANDAENTKKGLFILGELLNLMSNSNDQKDGKMEIDELTKPKILEQLTQSKKEIVFSSAFTFFGTISPVGYILEAYNSSNFDKKNPKASQIPVAILSTIPQLGLAYTSSRTVGQNLVSFDEKGLVDVAAPKAAKAVRAIITLLFPFAGGTNAKVNFDNLKDINIVFAHIMEGIGALGAGITNSYYTLKLLDDLMIYFAEHCADPDTRRLIHFVLEARKMENLIRTMTLDNFNDLTKHILMDDNIELKNTFCAAIQDRMTGATYNHFMKGKTKQDKFVEYESVAKPKKSCGCSTVFCGSCCCGLKKRKGKKFNDDDTIVEVMVNEKTPLTTGTPALNS